MSATPELDPKASASDRPKIPVLVGITGKRALDGQETHIRERLAKAFERLDKELPSAPKVLLSGLAVGADTIAAQLALERRNWLVAAVLPLALPLYLEDFADPAKAELTALLAHPKVKQRVLAPLVEPNTGVPLADDDLRRHEGGKNPLRTRHYEQLGLWLADTATVLIAVLPAEERPDRIGGTARVVEYRLTGSPDAAAREVMQASREICPPPVLDRLGGSPVWRIDLPAQGQRAGRLRRPFRVQLPGDTPRRKSFRHGLEASLAVARGIDGLARRTAAGDAAFAWPAAASDPVATLGRVRSSISAIQMPAKAQVVRSVTLLALLFSLAVLAFESYAELASDWWLALIPYLVLVGAAVVVHWLVGWKRWQRIAEDYRSVDEALRVQRACWSAGLSAPEFRADGFYFSGAAGSFGRLRAATRSIVEWVLLCEHPVLPPEDWDEVDGTDGRSWVPGQIRFFEARHRERRRTLADVDIASWILFFSAQILALWLTFYLYDSGAGADAFRDWFSASVGIGIGVAFAPIVLILWAARHWLHRYLGSHKGWTALFAVPIGLVLAFGIDDIAVWLAPSHPNGTERAFVIAILVLSAIAGAIRFGAEKLAWEAEAHRYAEALELFTHAKRELEAIDQERIEPAAKLARKRELILTLGRKALLENESWVRAHRERPVEQLVGG